MTPQLDLYAVLGLERHATPSDIRRAYRQSARESHPDLNQGDTSALGRFLDVQRAYEVLADSRRRAAYDQETAQASVFAVPPAQPRGAATAPTGTVAAAEPEISLGAELRETLAVLRVVARRSAVGRRMRQLIRYLERL